MKSTIIGLLAFGLLSLQSLAQTSSTKNCHSHGACKRVELACQAAGFVKGQFKKGFGLWRDCVDPLIQGTTPTCEVGVTCKPLPTDVNEADIAACKQACSKFGEGKVGG